MRKTETQEGYLSQGTQLVRGRMALTLMPLTPKPESFLSILHYSSNICRTRGRSISESGVGAALVEERVGVELLGKRVGVNKGPRK